MYIGVYLYQDAPFSHLSGLCTQASQSPGIPGDVQDAPDKTAYNLTAVEPKVVDKLSSCVQISSHGRKLIGSN